MAARVRGVDGGDVGEDLMTKLIGPL